MCVLCAFSGQSDRQFGGMNDGSGAYGWLVAVGSATDTLWTHPSLRQTPTRRCQGVNKNTHVQQKTEEDSSGA